MFETPLIRSVGLSDLLGAEISCKLELFQPTGSYKVRGAFNAALSLTDEERGRGLISFSAGNLAIAKAFPTLTELALTLIVSITLIDAANANQRIADVAAGLALSLCAAILEVEAVRAIRPPSND